MISAFFGVSGRNDATGAALVLAHVQAAGQPTTLVRLTETGGTTLPAGAKLPAGLIVVEQQVETAVEMGLVADMEIAKALQEGRNVVLDLPVACLADEALRSRIDVALLPVGPTPLDEHAAALACVEPRHMTSRERRLGQEFPSEKEPPTETHEPAPAWLLGCGRGGGTPAARAFARSMALALARLEGRRPRVLPLVLPAPTRTEANSLLAGELPVRLIASGLLLLAALDLVRRDPFAAEIAPDEFAAAAGAARSMAVAADARHVGERLRDLADDLDAIRDGATPTPADLADAPLLEAWSFEQRSVQVLTGRVYGHPTIVDGRRVTSSDLYASDGDRWGRTLSRYYRLGRPARGARARLQ